MKKSLLASLIALGLTIFLVGCGDTPAEDEGLVDSVDEVVTEEAAPVVEDDSVDDEETVNEVTFELDGGNYYFSETELTVQSGDTVRIVFTNVEGFHDWVLDEFGAATAQIEEGETVEVTFVADAAGTYEYYCSVGNHREQGMVGTLVVE